MMPALIYFILALINVPFIAWNGYLAIHAIESGGDPIISLVCALISAFAVGWCCAFGTIKVIQKLAS